jgi:hypothetical protein
MRARRFGRPTLQSAVDKVDRIEHGRHSTVVATVQQGVVWQAGMAAAAIGTALILAALGGRRAHDRD